MRQERQQAVERFHDMGVKALPFGDMAIKDVPPTSTSSRGGKKVKKKPAGKKGKTTKISNIIMDMVTQEKKMKQMMNTVPS